ncbi:MAG: hydrogenase nickel incorporation protein HypB [Bacteroidales bacterium]|nr:hydrogenase nickel incorporation protein HypB [Bacteroidales bacterium]MCF8336341.1 hydrogenase nickel incorporation protein HypB [Bacteroidales bacterium]
MEIKVLKNVLDKNMNQAEQNRQALMKHNVKMVNFISSPGAGKTTLLEKTIPTLQETMNVAVIEGDAFTSKDAERLQQFNIPIVQINTEGTCHLDSSSIESAFAELDLQELDIILTENVGNLICPTAFDLGEDFRIAVLSTTEGDDKPAKYPMLFRQARAVVLNKADLLPYIDFDNETFKKDLQDLNPNLQVFETSSTLGTGLWNWVEWLEVALEKEVKRV